VDYFEMPNGLSGVLGGAALIFFAYIGFEDIANIGEETKNPRKVLPKALMAAVVITTVLYVLVGLSVVSLVDWRDLSKSQAPLAFAVSSVIGGQAFWIMAVVAMIATANTVLVSLLVASRMIYGMACDGVLPKYFSDVHPRRLTPHKAIIAAMLVSMAFVLLGQLDLVAGITDFGTLLLFMFVNAAAILLRYRMPHARRAYKTPLNIGRFPLVPFFGLITAFVLATHLQTESILIGSGLAAAGVIVFLLYVDDGGGLRYAGLSGLKKRASILGVKLKGRNAKNRGSGRNGRRR